MSITFEHNGQTWDVRVCKVGVHPSRASVVYATEEHLAAAGFFASRVLSMWAQDVLDAYVAKHQGCPWETSPNSVVPLPPERAWVCCKSYDARMFYGPTAHAARAAAAAALVAEDPSLPTWSPP